MILQCIVGTPVPHPEEDAIKTVQCLDYIRRQRGDKVRGTLFSYLPIKGTPMYDDCISKGLLDPRWTPSLNGKKRESKPGPNGTPPRAPFFEPLPALNFPNLQRRRLMTIFRGGRRILRGRSTTEELMEELRRLETGGSVT